MRGFLMRNSKNPARGGAFAADADEVLERINSSVEFDYLLAPQELKVAAVHITGLREKGLINKTEEAKLRRGVEKIAAEVAAGKFKWQRRFEDVHMNIEARLRRLVGTTADKFHSGRSRNDLVATDLRLWIKTAAAELDKLLSELQSVLLKRAQTEADTLMPGFTHLQPAAVVTMGSHLLAYVHMLGRDRRRLRAAAERADECPMGAAALAGSALAAERKKTAERLGFKTVMTNPLDAVSARDFALEFLAAAAIGATHLSKLGEELVLWASAGFGFIEMSDEWSTGSSVLPQKRNPDAAELIRAKASRQLGHFVSLAGVIKGLPLAYSKDLQEDKEPVFASAMGWELILKASIGMLKTLKFNRSKMAEAIEQGHLLAVDMAEWLVTRKKMPFRLAHHKVGALARVATAKRLEIHRLSAAEIKKVVPEADEQMMKELDPRSALERRRLCAPKAVKKEITELKKLWRLK